MACLFGRKFNKCKSNEQALNLLKKLYGLNDDCINNIAGSEVGYIKTDLHPKNVGICGPLLAYKDEKPLIVLSGPFNKRYYYDENGQKQTLSKKNVAEFDGFYYISPPFPDGVITQKKLYGYMLKFFSAKDVFLIAVLSIISVLLGLVFPKMSEKILNLSANDDGALSVILLYFVIAALAIIVGTFLQIAIHVIRENVGVKILYNCKSGIINRLFKMPVPVLEKTNRSDIWELASASYLHIMSLTRLMLTGGIALCFVIAYMIQLSGYLHAGVLWIALIMIVAIVLMSIFTSRTIRNSRKSRNAEIEEQRFLVNALSGISKIRQTGVEKQAISKSNSLFKKFYGPFEKTLTYQNLMTAFSSFLICATTFVLLILSYLSGSDMNTFIVVIIISSCLLSQVGVLASHVLSIADTNASWGVISAILEEERIIPDARPDIPHFTGSLEIKNLSYQYETNATPTLRNLNISLREGEYVAIVGKTGCGKTTLLKLILGLLTPQAGDIIFGGYNIRDYKQESIVKKIGVVMQDDFLVPGSIKDNLSLYNLGLSEGQMWTALEKASIADYIRTLPRGLDTVIGTELSGGQMQRIMIARAIANNPAMLVFDEATSALDNISQRVIKESLDQMQCTKLIVAHRLSTIKDCDRILVMDKGEIVEEGSYEQLLTKQGLFYELVERQKL